MLAPVHGAQVKVHTTSYSDPFDGDVYLTLAGLEGSSSEVRLTNSSAGNFLAGAAAEFSVKLADVGTINNATVRMVRAGRGADGGLRECGRDVAVPV